MKVAIITNLRFNAGAFFQAYALRKFISESGYDAATYPTNYPGLKLCLKNAYTHLKKRKLRAAAEDIEKTYCFGRIRKYLREDPACPDCFLIGSDEIWNFKRPDMRKYPEFCGVGLPGDRPIFSYAPSAADSEQEHLEKFQPFQQGLESCFAISVRDEHTVQAVQPLTDKKVELVLDPTFLIKTEEYKPFVHNVNEKNYIAIYGYSFHKNEKYVAMIREFAQKRGLRIVSIGNRYPWADKNVTATPENFVSYLYHAQYTITDTFHGTVFSILFKKEFAVLRGKSRKALDLLERFDAKDRFVEDALKIPDIPVDYDKLYQTVDRERNRSIAYLTTNLALAETMVNKK